MDWEGRVPGTRRAGRRRVTAVSARRPVLLLFLLFGCTPLLAGAQLRDPVSSDDPGVPARAIALSAALPGLGHHLAGQKRWAGYLLADALSWVAFTESRRVGQGLEDAYRDLAWVAARYRIAPRRDGEWQYYEELLKFGASGALDVDRGREGVQPETDPLTHNGTIWALARDLFLPPGVEEGGGAAYARALEYYLRRGIPPEFAWDWRDNEAARSSYRGLIDASDRERRRSVGYAGALLANRVLSVVDLYVTSRSGAGTPLSVRLQTHWDPAGERPWILLRVAAP